MPQYVLIIEPWGCDPTVVGPFDSHHEADDWRRAAHARGRVVRLDSPED